jgi:AraC family transcriptional regulator, arabinose operon regulatory protein
VVILVLPVPSWNGVSATPAILSGMDELPAQVRADRLMGHRLRIGVYGGKNLDVDDFATREYAVVWVLRGEGTYRDDRGRTTAFSPGDVYQRFPAQPHGTCWKDASHGLMCFAAIPAALLAGLRLANPPGLGLPVFRVGLDPDLARRWAALAVEVRDAPEADLPRQLAAVFSLVCDLQSRFQTDGHRDPWLVRALELIDAHLTDHVPMPVILAPLGGSYTANRSRFAEAAGHSPGAYRIRRRMERAQDLLASSPLSVAEIAERLGFDEPANFSKHFRIHCGCTPR